MSGTSQARLLRDYALKRERAVQHADCFRRSLESFEKLERDPILGEFDKSSSLYRFKVPLEAVDPVWTLMLGDFAYNTRSALNYLITALVRSTGGEENARHEFPIYGMDRDKYLTTEQWWVSDQNGTIKRKIEDTPTGTKDVLKTLQPFYGVPTTDPFRHPLSALHLMTNRDKHRRLNLLARGATVSFVDAGRKPVFDGPAVNVGRIAEPDEGNAYTATLTVSEKFKTDVYLLASYDVRLHEPPELFGNAIETLTLINQFIDNRVLPAVKGLMV